MRLRSGFMNVRALCGMACERRYYTDPTEDAVLMTRTAVSE